MSDGKTKQLYDFTAEEIMESLNKVVRRTETVDGQPAGEIWTMIERLDVQNIRAAIRIVDIWGIQRKADRR